MKNEIEIIDTNDEFKLRIGNHVFDGNNILDYKIERRDGQSEYKVIITFLPSNLITNINLKNMVN